MTDRRHTEHILELSIHTNREIFTVVSRKFKLMIQDNGIKSTTFDTEFTKNTALHLKVVTSWIGGLTSFFLPLLIVITCVGHIFSHAKQQTHLISPARLEASEADLDIVGRW